MIDRTQGVTFICVSAMIYFLLGYCLCLSEEVTGALARVEDTVDPRYRYPEAILETRFGENSGFKELEVLVQNTWEVDLDRLAEIAPTESAKVIYLRAAQSLSISDYTLFLRRLVPLVKDGQLKREHFRWALVPNAPHLRRFWYESRDNPEFRAMSNEAQGLFLDKPEYLEALRLAAKGEIERPALGTGSYSLEERRELREHPPLDKNQEEAENIASASKMEVDESDGSSERIQALGESSRERWIGWIVCIAVLMGAFIAVCLIKIRK